MSRFRDTRLVSVNLQEGAKLWNLKEGGRSCKQHQVEHWKTIFKFGNFKGVGKIDTRGVGGK